MEDLSSNLLRFGRHKFLYFDFETISLNIASTHYNKPWQVGYCLFENNKLLYENVDYIYWENLKLSKGAARITKFNEVEYKEKAIDPSTAFNNFANFFLDEEHLLVGANVYNFDLYVYNLYRRLLNLPTDYSFLNRLIDIQNIEKSIAIGQKIPNIKSKDWAAWNFKMSNVIRRGLKSNVSYLCDKYDVEYNHEKLHDAGYDAKITQQIFNQQIKKYDLGL